MKVLILSLLLLPFCTAQSQLPLPLPKEIEKIAFGSCFNQEKACPLFETIAQEHSDLWIWLGDNVYVDTYTERSKFENAYAKLAAHSGYKSLQSKTPVIATWDDHDYGENDVGREYPLKDFSKKQFLDFFGEPKDSVRRSREGIYTSYEIGSEGRKVQIILLDTRSFRSPLLKGAPRFSPRGGSLQPTHSPSATVLGPEQWAWLERELRKPASLRLICSSIQFINAFDGWEAWANFPSERTKMMQLLKSTQAKGVVFLSGDAHKGELNLHEESDLYSLWDVTSSGINKGLPHTESTTLCGESLGEPNYGLLSIDWNKGNILFEIKTQSGETQLAHKIPLKALTFQRESLTLPQAPSAIGQWQTRFGELEITFDQSLGYKAILLGKTFPLSAKGQSLFGKTSIKELGGNAYVEFTPTRQQRYLLGTFGKHPERMLFNINGWKMR